MAGDGVFHRGAALRVVLFAAQQVEVVLGGRAEHQGMGLLPPGPEGAGVLQRFEDGEIIPSEESVDGLA